MDDCKHEDSRVLQTRLKLGFFRRRRECKLCGFRWTTVEVPEEDVTFETEVPTEEETT